MQASQAVTNAGVRGVSRELLETVVQRLVDGLHPERIILFGSHVWGEPDRDSDLDLPVIVAESDLSPPRRATEARRCLRGLPSAFDILVRTRDEVTRWSEVNESLLSRIVRQGVALYG